MDNDNNNKLTESSEATNALDDSVVVRPIPEEELKDTTPKAVKTEEAGTEKNSDKDIDAGNAEEEEAQKAAEAEKIAEAEEAAKAEAESDRHLKEAIAEQAREDERPHSTSFTLGKILGGDILTAQTIRNNIWLIVLIVGFVVLYITNRYKVQRDLLEIDKLNTQLEDAKYRALSSSSNLTEKSRESHVIESLQNSPDSSLHQSDRPPYIIEVPEK